ncbi:MAG: hypothetical protein ABMB14_07030 [Myxococcota bacterium]
MSLAVAWFAVVGCKKVEPAPAALDDLLHYVWQNYDPGDDPTLAEAVVNLDAAVDGDGLVDAFDGTVSRLTADEAALVGVTDRDPADAPGVFLVNAFDCDPGQLEEVLSYPDQSELYDGVYSAYARTFDASRDAWLAGTADRVDYDIDYTAELLGATYDAHSRGALRRVPELDAEATPFGAFVVQRSYMPHPGAFEGDSNKSMDQDYQLELYYPRGDGRVVHVYGLWRQADFGSGFDMEDEGSQRILLNNLLDWDDDTAALCAEGRP